MRILSIRQPWAWAIVSGFKAVENRTWTHSYRGRLLIHAGKHEDYENVDWVMRMIADQLGIAPHEAMEGYLRHRHLGAIVGEVMMNAVVSGREARPHDPWYFGPHGFVLSDPIRYRPVPMRGMQGIFSPPDWFNENLLIGD